MSEFLQENIGFLVFFASLIIIGKFLLGPLYSRLDHIEKQLDNHIPTQIKELEDNQKELKDDIKALDQKIDRVDQKIDRVAEQTNQRLDKIFELLSSKG